MTTLGIFGGTFDPPHVSHAMAVLWALQSGAVDRVLVIPTARHAFGKQPGASFEQRLEMCRLALRDFVAERVEISDIEGRREGTSYMIDTVHALIAERPGTSFRLIVGSDIVGDLAKWRESGELQRLAPVLEVPRIVGDTKDAANGLRPGALPMLSSSMLREALARGQDVGGLVSHRVMAYIRANALYGRAS